MKNIEKPKRCKFLKYTCIIQWNGTSQNKHSNNANRTRILVPLFTLNSPFLFPRGRASSNTFRLRVFTLSLPPCLSSREPTHFTVPDLRLATRATTERANYRGSDYLANRREIIARDASEGAIFRAKIPLRGRSFLSNRSRYSATLPPITAIGFDPSRDIHFEWKSNYNFNDFEGKTFFFFFFLFEIVTFEYLLLVF